MNNKLICPFCGGEVHIAVCDDEGNIRDEEYEKDAWSGLGYLLMHENIDIPKDRKCPIATYHGDYMSLGYYVYDNREDAILAWQNCESI